MEQGTLGTGTGTTVVVGHCTYTVANKSLQPHISLQKITLLLIDPVRIHSCTRLRSSSRLCEPRPATLYSTSTLPVCRNYTWYT